MTYGKYYIFEITQDGRLKKASLKNFNNKESAQDHIRIMWHPMESKRLIAVKVFD